MRKLRVSYVPNEDTLCIPDGKAKEYVYNIVRNIGIDDHVLLVTCQELVVFYVRLAILEQLIFHVDVEFTFEDHILLPNKYGQLEFWPNGFCDYMDKVTEQMVMKMFDVFDNEKEIK